MKKITLLLVLSLLIPVTSFAGGGFIGVTPSGKVYGGVKFGHHKHHRHWHHRKHRYRHHHRHSRVYIYGPGPERFYPPPNKYVHVIQTPSRTIYRDRVVYVKPSQQYEPGQTATITHEDGTKEIIYLEGAKIRKDDVEKRESEDFTKYKEYLEKKKAEIELARLRLEMAKEIENLRRERERLEEKRKENKNSGN